MKFDLLSPAKVNLILRIGALRSDGFHDVATLMARLSWGDRIRGRVYPSQFFAVSLSGDSVGIPLEKNLIYRAAKLFHEQTKKNFELELHLTKEIPTEAGLGGGSSNAATVLRILGKKFRIPKARLLKMAASLGSDVAFFLADTNAAWCLGRGERLKELSIRSWPVIIVRPHRARVPTPWAYQSLDKRRASKARSWPLDKRLPESYKDLRLNIPALENDFEVLALDRFAELRRLKRDLARSGAVTGQMSGSGSCFFAIYEDLKAQKRAAKFLNRCGWQSFCCKIEAPV